MSNSQLGGNAIEFVIAVVFLIVMAIRIGKIKRIVEKIDRKLPILILFCAISFKAYSCPIVLQSKVIKWCGTQMTISADIQDTTCHYLWEYPNDSVAPYIKSSFILTKAGFDSLIAITKKAYPHCSNCAPFFKLKVFSPDSSCSSDWAYVNITHFPTLIETPVICLITIDSLNHNHLIIAKPAVSPDSIIIEKLTGNQWHSIHTIKKNDLLEFTDAGSNASIQTYSYRLMSYAYDSCLLQTNASSFSVVHTSILLQISANPVRGFNLSWSKYVGLNDSELAGYYIYKGSSYSNMNLADTTQSLQNTAWIDTNASAENYYYYVEAIKSRGCDLGQHMKKQLSVRSNTAARKVSGISSPSPELDARIINGWLYTNQSGTANVLSLDGKLKDSFSMEKETDLHLKKGFWLIQVCNSTGIKTFKVVKE